MFKIFALSLFVGTLTCRHNYGPGGFQVSIIHMVASDAEKRSWLVDAGRDLIGSLLNRAAKDPANLNRAYDDMLQYLSEPGVFEEIKEELQTRRVPKASFYDVVLDFILMDAFDDLASPPSAVFAVTQNRFLSASFKLGLVSDVRGGGRVGFIKWLEMGGEEWAAKDEEQMAELKEAAYWHGTLPRLMVDRILRTDGEFLLRYNDKEKNHGFALSVRWEGAIRHFRVVRKKEEGQKDTFLVKKEKTYASIRELVEHHIKKKEPLAKESCKLGPVALHTPVPRSRWELRAKDLDLQAKIGQGAFGEVWRAKYTRANEDNAFHTLAQNLEVAVKTCKEKGADMKIKFRKEAMFALHFNHKNVVKLLGLVLSEEPMMIVMEFLKNGSLLFYLQGHKKTLSTARLKTFCVDAARGMAYLEGQKILHRDVASRNCLVSAREEVKISDFGLAKAQLRYKMQMGKVAIKWMSPESMKIGEYTSKSDVWAFGVLLWEVWTFGAEPYPGLSGAEVKRKVMKEKYHMEPPSSVPAKFAAAMLDAFENEPAKRPSFSTILAKLEHIGTPDSRSSIQEDDDAPKSERTMAGPLPPPR